MILMDKGSYRERKTEMMILCGHTWTTEALEWGARIREPRMFILRQMLT